MRSPSAFLPPHLVRSLGRRKRPARLPSRERMEAALLLSDISGFTALTEKLQTKGRQGAEEIADVVNSAFRPAIRAIERESGSVTVFGGDALLAIFPGGGAVGRAVASAEAIRDLIRRRGKVSTSTGSVRLGIAQTVHHGEILGVHLGRPGQRHYLLAGRAVQALARFAGRGEAGEIRLSRPAQARRNRERRASSATETRPRPDRELLASYFDPRIRAHLGGFEGEYRKCTVLFLETRGPSFESERGLALANGFFCCLADRLDRYGGALLKSDVSPHGDRWLCVFGIPHVHEDDADRAARVALEILHATPKGMKVRGGMHDGTVANIEIGTRSRRSFDVMGDAVNTASRAAEAAGCGEVMITEEASRRLSSVETRPRGVRSVKGKREPLRVRRLTRATTASRPIQVSAPLVGRKAELARLRAVIDQVQIGRGQVVAITGEAGIGKTRLRLEAAMLAAAAGLEVHEGRCVSFGGTSYGAIAGLIRAALDDSESGRDLLLRLQRETTRLAMSSVDHHHLAEVLGLQPPDSPIRHLDGEAIRLNNRLAIEHFLRARAAERPLFLVLEDMHWSDELTREVVMRLAEALPKMPIGLVLLYRQGYQPPSQAAVIDLQELTEPAVEELLAAHLGVVPDEVSELVKRKAEGNPFYVEEVVRHLLETGILALADDGYRVTREPRDADLPATLESLIAARLDRLSPAARRILQWASVIGRRFDRRLLARFQSRPLSRRALSELRDRALLLDDGGTEHAFKHALTRDVAYAGILTARRRELHRKAAESMESVYAGDREPHLAALGHHWERALEAARARECYLAGARRAAARYAHEAAERLYRAYLRLVAAPDQESITARSELALKVLTVQGRMEEAVDANRKSLEEARELGDAGTVCRALRRLGGSHRMLHHYDRARELLGEALTLARTLGDRVEEGHVVSAIADLNHGQGRTEEARRGHERALELARSVGDKVGKAKNVGNLGSLLIDFGELEEAERLLREALAITVELRDRRSEGSFLTKLGDIRQLQGRGDEARPIYRRALAIHQEVGHRRFEGYTLGNIGQLELYSGRLDHAQRLFETAVAGMREIGDRANEGAALLYLAAIDHHRGNLNAAHRGFQRALQLVRQSGHRYFEGSILQSWADLDVAKGRYEEAVRRLREAVASEVELGNRIIEASARCKLAEQLVSLGEIEEARATSSAVDRILRSYPNEETEADLCAFRARILRVIDGRPAAAERWCRKAEKLLASRGSHPFDLGRVICLRGHNALALGKPAERQLKRAAVLLRELDLGPRAPLAKEVSRLEGAQRAFDAGRPLLRGECPHHVPAGLRRWLEGRRAAGL